VKTEILDRLLSGDLGLGFFIRLVFARAVKVIAVCLILTLIVWLIYMGKFTLAAFLAGSAFGLFVFFVLRQLKDNREEKQPKTTAAVNEDVDELNDTEKFQQKTSVED
jgi:Ca2+/Na+ antiporter